MPFNGTGGFVPLPAPDFPAVAGTTIVADYFNNDMQDVFDGLSNCMTRDGQSPATANIPMGGFKLTGVGSPVSTGDVLTWGNPAQVSALTVFAATGTTNSIIRSVAGQIARLVIAGNAVDPLSQGLHLYQDAAGLGVLNNVGSNPLLFATSSVERMRILADGKVGIGTTSPTQKLDVAGNIVTQGTVFVQAGGADSVRAIGDAAYFSFFNTANTVRTGFIQAVPGNQFEFGCEAAGYFRWSQGGKAMTWGSGGLAPTSNNDQVCGQASTRWSTVYGVNGDFTNGVNKLKSTPINNSNLAAGELFVTSGTITFGAPGTAGDVYYAFNNSGSSVTVVQGGGLTMRLAGTTATGNRTLLPYGFIQGVYIDANTIVLTGSGLI